MHIVKDCNPVRVQDVYVTASQGAMRVNVNILNSSMPVTITETDVIRVKKRKLWGLFQRNEISSRD
eukprot:234864-Hanusia_phi.AAC.3